MIPESAKINLGHLQKQKVSVRKIIDGKSKSVFITALDYVRNAFKDEPKDITQEQNFFYQLMVKFLNDERLTAQEIEAFESLKLPKTPVAILSWLPKTIQSSFYASMVAQVALKLPEWVKLNTPNKTDAEWVVVEKDNNSIIGSPSPQASVLSSSPPDSTHSSSRNNSAGSATDNISAERKALTGTLKLKKIANNVNLFNRDSNFTNAVIDVAYDDLIRELQDPTLKISDIRKKERVFDLNKSGYTIDNTLSVESKALLDKTQEKEEGKIKEEKTNPSIRPLEKSERENKVGFIIIHAKNIFDANNFSGLSLNNLKILKNQIAQIRKLKDELKEHGQPLKEDDIKNYDQNNINIVGANAASYWNICEKIDVKAKEVNAAITNAETTATKVVNAESKEISKLNEVCNRLTLACENKMLDIYQKEYQGVAELPHDCSSIENLKSLNELRVILNNNKISSEDKLYQFANKIYDDNAFKTDETFLVNVEIVLIENPLAVVAILLRKFENYKKYMHNNDGEGTSKWKVTEDIISILKGSNKPSERLVQAERMITENKQTLSNARNPLACFINLWAWVQSQYKQFSTGDYKTKMFAAWQDAASARSKGAGVVTEAEVFLKASTYKKV